VRRPRAGFDGRASARAPLPRTVVATREGTFHVKRMLTPVGFGLLLVVAAAQPGCRWGDRDSNVEETSVIDGVSVLEFDGVSLYVKRAVDAAGLFLVVNGRIVDQVRLHVGDGFVITDGQSVHRA
jgi:hypothetical protein